jgi:hypothetical protein
VEFLSQQCVVLVWKCRFVQNIQQIIHVCEYVSVCECVCVEVQFEAFVKCRWRFLQNRSLMIGLVPEASFWPVIKMSMYHTVSRVKLLWGGGRGNVCLLKFDISLDLKRSNKFVVQIGYLYLIVLGLIMWLLYLSFKNNELPSPKQKFKFIHKL